MFQHMFSSMNEWLDEIKGNYSVANAEEKKQYDLQISELKKASDNCMEQWLDFEQKLSDFNQLCSSPAEQQQQKPELDAIVEALSEQIEVKPDVNSPFELSIPNEAAALISRGQGYYKLFMFKQAAPEFELSLVQAPECNLARLFLGMTYMHLQNWSEAERHFQLLVVLTDFPKWLAIGYNALGCIQAIHTNLAQAEQLFMKAYELCPSFKESLSNLRACQETPEALSLYFGSTELCCL